MIRYYVMTAKNGHRLYIIGENHFYTKHDYETAKKILPELLNVETVYVEGRKNVSVLDVVLFLSAIPTHPELVDPRTMGQPIYEMVPENMISYIGDRPPVKNYAAMILLEILSSPLAPYAWIKYFSTGRRFSFPYKLMEKLNDVERRDRQMAGMIRKGLEYGDRAAVVGIAHVPGIIRNLQDILSSYPDPAKVEETAREDYMRIMNRSD